MLDKKWMINELVSEWMNEWDLEIMYLRFVFFFLKEIEVGYFCFKVCF